MSSFFPRLHPSVLLQQRSDDSGETFFFLSVRTLTTVTCYSQSAGRISSVWLGCSDSESAFCWATSHYSENTKLSLLCMKYSRICPSQLWFLNIWRRRFGNTFFSHNVPLMFLPWFATCLACDLSKWGHMWALVTGLWPLCRRGSDLSLSDCFIWRILEALGGENNLYFTKKGKQNEREVRKHKHFSGTE